VNVAGICDRDAEGFSVEGVRDRDHALEHVHRDLAGRLLLDADEGEVDERELEAAGARAREPLARGDALVHDRLRERAALLHAPADGCEPVAADEAGRLDEVGDDLCDLVHGERGAAQRRIARRRAFGVSGGTGDPELVGPLQVHRIPRTRYRQNLLVT
jgi:hypothetical protein